MEFFKYKILHITPHLGGGVGSVLTKYFMHTKSNVHYTHTVFTLEDINSYSKKILVDSNIFYKENLSKNYKKIIKKIPNFDIVLIHWWNHPLLYEFLIKYTLPECRLIMWSHISGLFAPSNFTKPLFNYADRFIFTTPISYNSDIVKKLSKKNFNKINTVCSTVGVQHLKRIDKDKHNTFNVGYLGTVDYSKLHKDFLDISNSVEINGIKFIVCGGDNEQQIKEEAIQKGIESKFVFTGKIANIEEYLCQFDVFGYPLSPYHFGTCDQVLKEAMAVGIVPVVFNNPMENSMIKHLQTGIIVKNKNEYVAAIKLLYEDSQLRKELSNNAKQFAFENFSLEKMIDQWERIFEETLSIKPHKKKWNGKYKGKKSTPLQIFLESTGENKKYFKKLLTNKNKINKQKMSITLQKKIYFPDTWQSNTKGTLNHYSAFFKNKKLDILKTLFNDLKNQ